MLTREQERTAILTVLLQTTHILVHRIILGPPIPGITVTQVIDHRIAGKEVPTIIHNVFIPEVILVLLKEITATLPEVDIATELAHIPATAEDTAVLAEGILQAAALEEVEDTAAEAVVVIPAVAAEVEDNHNT